MKQQKITLNHRVVFTYKSLKRTVKSYTTDSTITDPTNTTATTTTSSTVC